MKVVEMYYIFRIVDMDRAVRFWEQALGLVTRLKTPQWSELACGAAIVALHHRGTGRPLRTELGFDVDDIESACDSVKRAGGKVVEAATVRAGERIKLAVVADTDGNEFMFSQSIG